MLQTEYGPQTEAAANDNLETEMERQIITDAVPVADIDMAAAGFKSVRAWIKNDNPKKTSGQQRHRARRQAEGEKQLNLFAPDDEICRNALKLLADALTRRVVRPDQVIVLLTEGSSGSGDDVPPDPLAPWLDRCRAILGRGGLRARVLYLLLARWQRD